jgi:hypothetical protein
MKTKINSIIAIGILIFIAMACNASFTTANISSYNFGKNNSANPPTTNFEVTDKIYCVAVVSGAMGKHKMRFKMEPVSKNDVQPLTKDIDFEGSRPVYLELTVPTGGEYKVEATLLDESGKEVDKKSGTFTVKGGSTSTTTTEKPKDSTNTEKDSETEDSSN